MSAPPAQKGPFWMADAPAIPRGLLAKIRWVIDHHPWIWLLVGVEQLATDHILSGVIFLIVFGVNLFIYEMWERFSQLAKRITGRRMAFAFIVIGAICLAVGITLLAKRPGATPVSNAMPVSNATLAAPKIPMTDEDRQFRLDLKKFVISPLDDAYLKLQRVFGDLLQKDNIKNGDLHQHIMFFVQNFNNPGQDLSSIKSLFKVSIDSMDDNAIQAAIVSFITNDYRLVQLKIWHFNQIAQIDIVNLDSFKKWSEADFRCLTELRNLKTYPQANAIKQAIEAHMGPGRLWEKGE
jgi:hypothetical protein